MKISIMAILIVVIPLILGIKNIIKKDYEGAIFWFLITYVVCVIIGGMA